MHFNTYIIPQFRYCVQLSILLIYKLSGPLGLYHQVGLGTVAWELPWRCTLWGLPGGWVVKNPPANAGDMGWSPVREDPACCAVTKPGHHNYWACGLEPVLCNERPRQWEASALQLQSSPRLLQLEKAHAAAKTQHSHKKRHFHWGKKRYTLERNTLAWEQWPI